MIKEIIIYIAIKNLKYAYIQIIILHCHIVYGISVTVLIQSTYGNTLVNPEGSVLSHPFPLKKLETPSTAGSFP